MKNGIFSSIKNVLLILVACILIILLAFISPECAEIIVIGITIGFVILAIIIYACKVMERK